YSYSVSTVDQGFESAKSSSASATIYTPGLNYIYPITSAGGIDISGQNPVLNFLPSEELQLRDGSGNFNLVASTQSVAGGSFVFSQYALPQLMSVLRVVSIDAMGNRSKPTGNL